MICIKKSVGCCVRLLCISVDLQVDLVSFLWRMPQTSATTISENFHCFNYHFSMYRHFTLLINNLCFYIQTISCILFLFFCFYCFAFYYHPFYFLSVCLIVVIVVIGVVIVVEQQQFYVLLKQLLKLPVVLLLLRLLVWQVLFPYDIDASPTQPIFFGRCSCPRTSSTPLSNWQHCGQLPQLLYPRLTFIYDICIQKKAFI